MRKHQITQKLDTLNIADYEIRKRDQGDLSEWFGSINSVICPTSVKAEVRRNGEWENCIVSGRISEESKDKVQLSLYFSDATLYTAEGSRKRFLKNAADN